MPLGPAQAQMADLDDHDTACTFALGTAPPLPRFPPAAYHRGAPIERCQRPLHPPDDGTGPLTIEILKESLDDCYTRKSLQPDGDGGLLPSGSEVLVHACLHETRWAGTRIA